MNTIKNKHHLLDTIIGNLELKNDAALSRALEVSPVYISKVRNRALKVSASFILRLHDLTNMAIKDLKFLAAEAEKQFTSPQDDRVEKCAA